jgi:4-hydroxy-tetrahydrodipicolinate reductase
MPPLPLLITGARGRMGQAIISCAMDMPTLSIAAQIDLGDPLAPALAQARCVIDFSSHHFTSELVAACRKASVPMVIGTTGHTDDELALIRDASSALPIVHAPNFSIGVNTLFWLAAKATQILGPSFDLEVLEMHHRHKTDSPSGTARRLAEILAENRGLSYDSDARHGRHGDVGARTPSEIGVHAIRGGDVVGDHTAIFAALGERIELTHKASSRDTFASGSLRAALWLQDKPAGLYDMQDVLGLR